MKLFKKAKMMRIKMMLMMLINGELRQKIMMINEEGCSGSVLLSNG